MADSLLLDVWREACRHIEIHESGGKIARMVAQHLPLATLLVRRFDPQHLAIETVAVGQATGKARPAGGRTTCTSEQFRRLLAWAAKGKLLHGRRIERSAELSLLAPDSAAGDVLAGPLIGPEGSAGVLVALGDGSQNFKPPHVQLFQTLLPPFAAALENDRRLHELAALREAAEADRRSLLSRLGRQEVASEPIVGADSGLRHVMERVQLVAQSDVPVLILGETGTGKEVVSRAIHTRSARASGPFIRVNCGAIPPDLIDSQLFGHEKGSFTGATETRQGWFERADRGTLFLDEIGELPLAAQVRLLRVLQDGFIERVGGREPIHVDVRIVAATHRDLAAMVKTANFREDLWYRVNVFPILLPRLRERSEDIPALARHFVQRAALRFGFPPVMPGPRELQALLRYSWPGNIRELAAVIDRAVILGEGRSIEIVRALGFAQPSYTPAPTNMPTLYEVVPESDSPAEAVVLPPTSDEIEPLAEAMRRHIERALAATRGRVEGKRGAAALLRINPHTLRARMRKLHINWARHRSD